MKNAINKLAQLHIRTRQLSDFENINRKISPYNPIIYAFENYQTPQIEIQTSPFILSRENFWNAKPNRNISSYSKRVISSEIGAIAQDNKEHSTDFG